MTGHLIQVAAGALFLDARRSYSEFEELLDTPG